MTGRRGRPRKNVAVEEPQPATALTTLPQTSPLSFSVLSTSQSIDFYAESCGREEFVKAMRLCHRSQPIMDMLTLYDRLSEEERTRVSFDILCRHVGFDPDEFITQVTKVLLKARSRVLAMTLSNSAQKALEAGTKAAETVDGIADRKMIYQMAQMMPFDKANEININQNFGGYTDVPRFEDSADAQQGFLTPNATVVED